MSNKINLPIGIEFGKRDTDVTSMSSEEMENYKNKPNVVIENDEYEKPNKITELFFKINKIDNISLIEFVYGENSNKQEEDILEEELKNELNKYISEKLEKHNDLDDYPIFDYIKNGVIGKLMGNFDKELLFKKAFQNTNNKYPEKIVFQGGKRIYNKDDIKRKENACEISTTKEIKNHMDLLLHRIIYFYYKYMHTILDKDKNNDDLEKKTSPFNYRIKLIQSINEKLETFKDQTHFQLIVDAGIITRSDIFKKDDKNYLEYKFKDIDYSIFDDVLLYLFDSTYVKENMWFKLLELNNYNLKISDVKKDKKIVSNTILFNFLKDSDKASLSQKVNNKSRSDNKISAPLNIEINNVLFSIKSDGITGIKPFDLLDCYELFLFKQIIFEFKVYLDDPEYCPFKIEKYSKKDIITDFTKQLIPNVISQGLTKVISEKKAPAEKAPVEKAPEKNPISVMTYMVNNVMQNVTETLQNKKLNSNKGGENKTDKNSILNDNMLGMDLWDTDFPEIDRVSVSTQYDTDKIQQKLVNTQFLFMVKYYNILAILYEKIIQKVPNEIVYGKIKR
jgi:hypothetical protein